MAISVISSQKVTTSGNITIPANCDYVVALVLGTTNPTINLVAMTQNCSNGVSISTMASPPTGTIGCTVGQSTRFVYLLSGVAVRDSEAKEGTHLVTITLTTSATDVVFGVTGGSYLKGDGVAFTYLDANTRGYKSADDTDMVCTADSGDFATYAAFISIMDSGAVETGDGTMICWIN